MTEATAAAGGTATAGTGGTGTGTTVEVTGAGAAAPAHWTAGLNDDLKGWATTKGFDKQDAGAVLDSYRNLEKLTGAPLESIVKLPKADDAAGWNAVFDKLGRPAKADDYAVTVPTGGDEKFAGWAKGVFHELGLTKGQGEKLAAKWNEHVGGLVKTQGETAAAAAQEAMAALDKEWGAAKEQNLKIVDTAAERLGMTNEHLAGLRQAMGGAAAAKFLHSLAVKLGEDKFVGGEGGGTGGFGVMTPAAAQAQIAEVRRDQEFIKKYTAGDFEAKKRMAHLHAMAYPDAVA
jgi:hypothetical protein